MDPLEQKIKKVLEDIPFGDNGSNILESNVVHSMAVEGTKASVVLVISEEYQNLEAEIGVRPSAKTIALFRRLVA